MQHLGTNIGSPAYIQQKHIHHGASIAPPPAPPSGGGGGPPPPTPGGGGPPTGPSCPAAGVHSSSPPALLLAALWPAMVAAPPHTAPGSSHPGYKSTCPQAHPATPSPADGVCHHNPLRPLPEERVMAPHQGHQTNASSLPSRAQQVTPRHPPTNVSLPAVVSPALDEPVLSASPPRAREVPHLHMHKTTTTDSISIYIIYIWTDISKDNINQKHTQYYTYLDGQTPPLEAAPCPGHPGSQPQHRGTEVLPAASAAISVPPLPKRSGHLRHHRGEPKLSTTTSIAGSHAPGISSRTLGRSIGTLSKNQATRMDLKENSPPSVDRQWSNCATILA
jgi:hypothetical protein